MTATLAAWLEQQLAADEALAMAATAGPWLTTRTGMWQHDNYVMTEGLDGVAMQYALVWAPGDAAHIAANDPAQTLRRVAAIRQVLGIWSLTMSTPEDGFPSAPIGGEGAEVYYDVLRALASQYADRDGYRAEEWA